MTQGKFTPGPWVADSDSQYIFSSTGQMVAEMRGYGAQLPMEANAHLIAAAPDMLDALIEIRAQMRELQGRQYKWIFERCDKAIRAASTDKGEKENCE